MYNLDRMLGRNVQNPRVAGPGAYAGSGSVFREGSDPASYLIIDPIIQIQMPLKSTSSLIHIDNNSK